MIKRNIVVIVLSILLLASVILNVILFGIIDDLSYVEFVPVTMPYDTEGTISDSGSTSTYEDSRQMIDLCGTWYIGCLTTEGYVVLEKTDAYNTLSCDAFSVTYALNEAEHKIHYEIHYTGVMDSACDGYYYYVTDSSCFIYDNANTEQNACYIEITSEEGSGVRYACYPLILLSAEITDKEIHISEPSTVVEYSIDGDRFFVSGDGKHDSGVMEIYSDDAFLWKFGGEPIKIQDREIGGLQFLFIRKDEIGI